MDHPHPAQSVALTRHRALGNALDAARTSTVTYLVRRGVPEPFAQDLVSDLTLLYLEHLGEPDYPEPVAVELGPWMRKAAFNDWLDYGRRHNRECALDPHRTTVIDTRRHVEDTLDFHSLGREIYGDAWPEKAALLDMRRKGFTYQEIALARRQEGERLFITTTSVASELSRIYATFRHGGA